MKGAIAATATARAQNHALFVQMIVGNALSHPQAAHQEAPAQVVGVAEAAVLEVQGVAEGAAHISAAKTGLADRGATA